MFNNMRDRVINKHNNKPNTKFFTTSNAVYRLVYLHVLLIHKRQFYLENGRQECVNAYNCHLSEKRAKRMISILLFMKRTKCIFLLRTQIPVHCSALPRLCLTTPSVNLTFLTILKSSLVIQFCFTVISLPMPSYCCSR